MEMSSWVSTGRLSQLLIRSIFQISFSGLGHSRTVRDARVILDKGYIRLASNWKEKVCPYVQCAGLHQGSCLYSDTFVYLSRRMGLWGHLMWAMPGIISCLLDTVCEYQQVNLYKNRKHTDASTSARCVIDCHNGNLQKENCDIFKL